MSPDSLDSHMKLIFLSTFLNRWRRLFNQIYISEPSSFVFSALNHPQMYIFSHAFWLSPPRTSFFDWLNVDGCGSLDRCSSPLCARASSPFPCPPLIYGRRRLSFSMTNLLKERESSSHKWTSLVANCCRRLFFLLLAAKEAWSSGMRTLDLQANTNCEACINPQDHGALVRVHIKAQVV